MATKLKSKQGLKDYLLLLSSVEIIDEARQAELLMRSEAGDPVAVRELVEAYLPKVLAWVSPRRGEALSFQELIALGNCALIETVKRTNALERSRTEFKLLMPDGTALKRSD